MDVQALPKFAVRGFFTRGLAWSLAAINLAIVPAHFYVSCQESVVLAAVGMTLLLVTSLFSIVTPREIPHRFRPLAFALAAAFAHSISMH